MAQISLKTALPRANKKSRNFGLGAVFNLMMNNEPLQDDRGQLRRLLSRLPDVPVASNFTARVLQAVELEETRHSGWRIFYWNWRVLFPRVAVTATVVGFAAVAFHQHELSVRYQKAESVYLVASQPIPSKEALENFDAIRRMSQTAHPDNDLLALASDMK